MDECQGVALQHAADTIQLHTNACHQIELRGLAAWVSGRPTGAIIAAELTFVCIHGFQISWMDLSGGHVTPVSFERPAADAADLADLLGSFLRD